MRRISNCISSRRRRSSAPKGSSHQHEVGLEHQCPGDRNALLLAAGQLPRPTILEAFQLHELERTLHPLGPLCYRHPAYFQRERQIPAHRHVRKQRVVLEHHSDFALVRGKAWTDTPSTRIVPAVVCSNPASIIRQVVLPDPEGPSRVRNSPRRTLKFRSSTTSVRPS